MVMLDAVRETSITKVREVFGEICLAFNYVDRCSNGYAIRSVHNNR